MDSRGELQNEMDHEILLPHEIMGTFYLEPELFAKLTGGSRQVGQG